MAKTTRSSGALPKQMTMRNSPLAACWT